MSTPSISAAPLESPNPHVSYKDPFIFQSGNLDVTKWKPDFCEDALTFCSSEIKFIVWAYSDGMVRFRLEYAYFNDTIEKQLQNAGLTLYGVGNHTTDGCRPDQLQAVHKVITENYGIVDPDQLIERLAKWGSYHFPELHLQSDQWHVEPTWIHPKRMEFANHDLKLFIKGDVDGNVHFEIQNLYNKSEIKEHLIKVGIPLRSCYFDWFSTNNPEQLQKVYQMLCKYYPLLSHQQLIERLAFYGNWKTEEESRNIPLEHIEERV